MASIALDFTCVYSTAAGTIFGTTDVYELGFSYISIGVFNYTKDTFIVRNTKILRILISTFLSGHP